MATCCLSVVQIEQFVSSIGANENEAGIDPVLHQSEEFQTMVEEMIEGIGEEIRPYLRNQRDSRITVSGIHPGGFGIGASSYLVQGSTQPVPKQPVAKPSNKVKVTNTAYGNMFTLNQNTTKGGLHSQQFSVTNSLNTSQMVGESSFNTITNQNLNTFQSSSRQFEISNKAGTRFTEQKPPRTLGVTAA